MVKCINLTLYFSFETEAQREPRQRPASETGRTLNKKSVAFAFVDNPERLPESIDEVGGWLNVRQVLSFDLGHQLQYRPQTAYVLRVRRGREQNPVKLLVTPTVAEWLEFMFMAVDITGKQSFYLFRLSSHSVNAIVIMKQI